MSGIQVRTALITGATGFVGSHLVRRLVRDGWQVHVVVRPESRLDQLREAQNTVVVHRHDGTTEQMLVIVKQAQPEIVFHLASLFISEHQPKDVSPLIPSNLLFGTQLLEAMKQAGVSRLVNVGTSWQHYKNEDYNPVNLYAATKQAFEDIVRFYEEAMNFDVVTLKLFDTYGPDDNRNKILSLLRYASVNAVELDMSYGMQSIDLVYIDDVIDAFVSSADDLFSCSINGQRIYAVSSGSLITLRELVMVYERIAGVNLIVNWGARPYRSREVMVPWNVFSTPPNWYPKIPLEEGISRVNRFGFRNAEITRSR